MKRIPKIVLNTTCINKIKKLLNRHNKGIKKGFSLIEVMISVSLFGIFFSSILFSYSSLIKLEIKSKEKIYEKIKSANEISKKYYIYEDE
ncbi:MAG: type II secretion system protein [Spirochaetes bacterium]|nr:type II secretion system protein [Spirochaetota bacterium]